MFHLARLACCAALVGLTILASFAVRPAVLADVGLDLPDLPDYLRLLDQEMGREEKLARQYRDFRAAIQAKRRLCQELIDGRRTLAQVARAFCELADRPEPEFRELLSRNSPAATSEESLCRHILGWVEKLLDEEPTRLGEVRRRLEGEMREHLCELQGGR